jgi:hypothetical protein
MTVTSGGTGTITFGTTGTTTITTNNKTIDHPVAISGTGSYTLLDSMTMGSTATSILTFTKGNLDINGNTLTALNIVASGAIARSITFNGGKIYVSGASTTAWTASGSNFTTAAGAGKGIMYMTSSSAKTFAGGSYSYAATLVQAGYGNLTITGNNTFANFKNSVVPANISITSNTTQTFTDNFQLLGTANALVYLNAVTSGTAGNVSLASGTVTCDYLRLKDSRATGGANWSAGNHSVNVSNNTGWYFTAAPTANPQMMMLFPL